MFCLDPSGLGTIEVPAIFPVRAPTMLPVRAPTIVPVRLLLAPTIVPPKVVDARITINVAGARSAAKRFMFPPNLFLVQTVLRCVRTDPTEW